MNQRPTPAQQKIIDEPGHLLVVAGPGSGKTGTIVRRIAAILKSPRTRVVAVSFTRDSAQELQARLRATVAAEHLARVITGTFHALSLRHLERSRPGLRVATPAQQRALLKACMREMDSTQRTLATQRFEQAKCSLQRAPEIESEPWFADYESMLQRNELIDLHDVMRQTSTAIASGALAPLACTHLLVDEAQDCDAVQYEWARAHATRGVLTTLVGDDDQTIYEWRRAIGYPGMQNFVREFGATVVHLDENFRSLSAIVEASDQLICGNNPHRLRKNPVARRGPGGQVELLQAASIRACAEAIVNLIRPGGSQSPADRGGGIDDSAPASNAADQDADVGAWAVLARTNHCLHLMQAALDAAGVRYHRNGGSLYDTPAASLLLSLLGSITHAQADPLGLDLAMLSLGTPAAVCGEILRAHEGRIQELMDSGECRLPADTPPALCEPLQALFRRIAVWRRFWREGEHIDLLDRLSRFVVEGHRPEEQELPQAICEAITRRLLSPGPGDFAARLRSLTQRERRSPARDGVALHTMHGSKGLEFSNVALLGVDDAIIPADPRRHAAAGIELNGIVSERRLLYVAMTRARNRLVIGHTAGKGSRFLGELPAGLARVPH
jgi:superfamily I DNA/RNA helicase